MNKELALRTFAYLIGHYKTHNATIINKQEIEAIEFILNDNEFLEQQLHDASIQIQELIEKDIWCPSNCEKLEQLQRENKQLKDKLSKIETLIINHNCDTGDIYYKYNSKFLKSELKQRILEIVYEQGSDK